MIKRLIKKSHVTSPLRYFFRMLKYPVLCCIDEQVFSASSENQFLQQLSSYSLDQEARYVVIDITGENWTFYPEEMLLSPLNFKKRWTKLQLIRLVNTRSNKSNPDELPYSEKSLTAKRFDRIFQDLVAMTNLDKNEPCV